MVEYEALKAAKEMALRDWKDFLYGHPSFLVELAKALSEKKQTHK